ncbi:Spy/CpxP family protein refolding chaperone [Paraglaciecola sp.]|uniref:Spy/CpxP family protein refolding chaperone n=1 Tax=Paraglaciecola sp. TaxID=1920173 RepID=UPI003EF83D4D
MFKLNKFVTTLAVCSSLVFAAQTFAKPEQGQRQHQMKRILSKLDITDTQKQDIKQIMQQARGDQNVSREDVKSFRQELAALIHAEDFDQDAIEALLTSKQEQRANAGLRQAQNKHAVWNLLTTEQQTQFANIIAEHKAKAEEGAGKRKKGSKGPKSQKRKMAKRLGLDEAQKTQLASIKTQTKESAGELKANLKAFKQAERTLIHSAEFSADAWASLHQTHQADFLAKAILEAKTKHQIWNVLTEEQQEKAQKMQRRMKMAKGNKGHKGKAGKAGKQQHRKNA